MYFSKSPRKLRFAFFLKPRFLKMLLLVTWVKSIPTLITSRETFNFEFWIYHFTTWFNIHLVSWVDPLQLPSLRAIGLVEEGILCFKFFMWPSRNVYSKSHVTPWVAFCCHMSPTCQVWWYRAWRRGDIRFSIRDVTFCDNLIRVLRLHYGLRFTIHQEPSKFVHQTSSVLKEEIFCF